MDTKYIILAGGEGDRWGDYMGIKKHWAVLNNEPIIQRIIRLLKENGASDIEVVSRDYNIDGVKDIRPRLNPDNFDADKFLSSTHRWSEGRTVIIYGDVYFSPEAISQIVYSPDTKWTLFCRPTASRLLNKKWGECFAVSFYDWDIERGRDELHQLVHLYKGKLLYRVGGWEWARLMAGIEPSKLQEHREKLDIYHIINDETDDVDTAEDFLNLKRVVG